MLIFYTLLALVALRVILVLVAVAVLVGPVSRCPACFQPTVTVRRRWLRPVRGIEWHWCAACGWQGPGRCAATARAPEIPDAPAS
ncbi:MAG: hypothetical protein IRZ00_12835 [Gemmatimonadetes bacterium]|nr:hypothetical protein [Gemmatimonadota bacterium]